MYAQTLAERGFLTIAFDPSFTGESGGQPRYVASPDINTEDFSAAVDFLSVQENVDPDRIGILGICGWGGMALNAAAIDTRIKATVASTMLHLDDKILLSWNSMMIAALSMLYRVSHNKKSLKAAVNAQKFIEKNLCNGTRLYTSWRDGKRSENSFLDDYAYYIAALIELYNSTLDSSYLEKAGQFCNEAIRCFLDKKNGGFYLSESENMELFLNPKEVYDGAIPSGNSVMAYNFVRLYQLMENEKYYEFAEKQLDFLSSQASDYPAGHCMFLITKMLNENPPEHITVALKNQFDLEKVKENISFLANISITQDNEEYPLMNDKTTYYVCKNHSCLPPVNEYVFTKTDL